MCSIALLIATNHVGLWDTHCDITHEMMVHLKEVKIWNSSSMAPVMCSSTLKECHRSIMNPSMSWSSAASYNKSQEPSLPQLFTYPKSLDTSKLFHSWDWLFLQMCQKSPQPTESLSTMLTIGKESFQAKNVVCYPHCFGALINVTGLQLWELLQAAI